MAEDSRYFELSLDSLRALGQWAADCAERALPIFENYADGDTRPRDAISEIRVFARGGERNAALRKFSLAAFAAARDMDRDAAEAAAQAAGLAASSAYTHPLRDVHQTKHVVGPAAYSALALELESGGDKSVGRNEIAWAIERVPSEVRETLREMPARSPGKNRLNELMYELDARIRDLPET